MPKMHQNTFSGQATPGPAGRAHAVIPRPPIAAMGELLVRGSRKGMEGRGGLLLRSQCEGRERREERGDRKGGGRESPRSQCE